MVPDVRTDGRNGRTDARTDDAKTISLRLRRGITKILMTNGSLMKVKSIAECFPWSILQYILPALSDNSSIKPIAVFLFESGRFTQVLLYSLFVCLTCKSVWPISAFLPKKLPDRLKGKFV